MGGRKPARPHNLRDLWRARGHGARGDAPGRAQAADTDPFRGAAGDVINGQEAEDEDRRDTQAIRSGHEQRTAGDLPPPLRNAPAARDRPANEPPRGSPRQAPGRGYEEDPAAATAGDGGLRYGRPAVTAQGQYGGRKVRTGTVVSDKMQKTVLVAVQANIRHRLYKKTVRRVRRFMAHDEREESRLGDRVRIVEARPLSRHKRWRVIEVLERAELPEVAPESIDLELLGEVKREEVAPGAEAAVALAETATETVAAPQPEAAAGPEAAAEEAAPPVEPTVEEVTAEALAAAAPPPEEPADAAAQPVEVADETSVPETVAEAEEPLPIPIEEQPAVETSGPAEAAEPEAEEAAAEEAPATAE